LRARLFGLEGIEADELRHGYEKLCARKTAASFVSGGYSEIARANRASGAPIACTVRWAAFPRPTFDGALRGDQALPREDLITKDAELPFKWQQFKLKACEHSGLPDQLQKARSWSGSSHIRISWFAENGAPSHPLPS
jgi:hypothetical protein